MRFFGTNRWLRAEDFAFTPAIFVAHFIADAFRRRNLAREKNW
jgi:hypothetical protein